MYYIKDPKKPQEVVIELVNELLRTKYNKTTFYCHNLAGFDVVFLLKVLIDYNQSVAKEDIKEEKKAKKMYKLSFKFRDNRIISLTIKRDQSRLKIVDSLNILNSGLRNLTKVYDTEYHKSFFPYKFAVESTLFYEGITPSITYFTDISYDEYSRLCTDNWSLKDEALKYLRLDLLSLYEVLSKANKRFFLDYDVDMTKSLTISGISLRLFLDKYYDNNIPVIGRKSVYTDIKEGYYGGMTEVYKPYGKNLFYYDINSLYPYAALNDMPGLTCKKILMGGKNEITFGWFYCVIDATNVTHKYLGLLPVRHDKLIFPSGKWKGWYFSEELIFAKQFGYKITGLKGYEFSRVNGVFDSYIKDIYNKKVTATNSTQRAISKSL